MTTRNDVNRLGESNRRLVAMARADLEELVKRIDFSNAGLARDALLEIVPDLVREYGDIAASVAADWYEEVRAAAGVASAHTATLSAGVDVAQVQGSVRWAAGSLWGENPTEALALLNGAMQRFISYSTRDTIARNVAGDRSKPRYARVPSGATTCAFCEMLASRGFVYHSKQTAGMRRDFHDDCNCQIVVEWDADVHHIDGYDPDAMFARYQAARQASGSSDPKDIAAAMRRMNPDQYTDGVHTHL